MPLNPMKTNPMAPFRSRQQIPALVLAVALLAMSAWAATGPLETAWRILAGGLLLAVLGWHLSASRRVLMLSPLLLLGLNSLLFYALLPAAVLPFATMLTQRPFYLEWAVAFSDSRGEALIFQFGLLCLGCHMLLSPILLRRRDQAPLSPPWPLAPRLRMTAIAVVLTLATLIAGTSTYLKLSGASSGLRQSDWINTPLTAATAGVVFLSALLLSGRVNRRTLVLIAVVVTVAIGSVFIAGTGKRSAYATIAIATLVLARPATAFRRNALLGGAFAVITIIGTAQALHWHASSPMGELAMLFEHKVWGRQIDSGQCLASVVDQRLTAPPKAAPGYFLAGLIPRALWPEKPSLSNGAQHAVEFCGQSILTVHSASITLLGEPIAQAGWRGLVTAEATLVVILGIVAWLAVGSGAVTTALCVSAVPWLVDFDQDLAFYIANAVKYTVMILPLAALAAWMNRGESIH